MRLTRVRLWPWSHPRRRGPGARTAGRGRRAPAGGGREGSRRPAGARAGLGARESARGPRSSVSPSRSAVAGSPARPRSSPRPLAAPGARRRPRVPAPPGRSHGAGRARPRSPGRPARWPPYPRPRLLLTHRAGLSAACRDPDAAEPSRRRPLGPPDPPTGFRWRHFRRGVWLRCAGARGGSETNSARGSSAPRWRRRWRRRRFHVFSAAGWNRWRAPAER